MKRSAELRDLSDDHHRALVMAKRAREIAQAGDRDAVVAQWCEIRTEYDAHLSRHFGIEENHLLPPVRRAGGFDLAQRVEGDHNALRAHLQAGPHDRNTLAAFADRLLAHVRFEERELFPWAEENLAVSDLQNIAKVTKIPSKKSPDESRCHEIG